MTTQPKQSNAKDLLSVKQVCDATGRTEMTVFNWRRGSARVDPCPSVLVPRGARHTVRFPRTKFLKWANAHGIEVDVKKLDTSSADQG